MSIEIPPITRFVFKQALDAARTDRALVEHGALQAEVHIGRKQADEIFWTYGKLTGEDYRNINWPVSVLGQKVYLVDSPSHFEVLPLGSFKKLGK